MIETIEQFVEFVSTHNPTEISNFGKVTAKQNPKYQNLWLFTYTAEAAFQKRWNFVERVSRGLIVDVVSKQVIARPFDKFFNFGENGLKMTGFISTISEKLDGSLGIAYFYDGQWFVATRGSFDSDQAKWATEFFRNNWSNYSFPTNYTFLFEIIYPENRVVLNYNFENLILLAMRETETGEFMPRFPDLEQIAHYYGMTLPCVYNFGNIEDVLKICGNKHQINFEGFVVTTSTGELWKFKSDWYVEQHRLISNLSYKAVLKEFRLGNDPIFVISQLDDLELRERFIKFYNEIKKLHAGMKLVFEQVVQWEKECNTTKKEFALKYNNQSAFPILTRIWDGKGYNTTIWKLDTFDNFVADWV